MDYELSEALKVNVGMHQGSMLPPFLFNLWYTSLNWQERVCLVSCYMWMI